MTYQLIYPNSYIKRVSKFIYRHPEVSGQYKKVLQLLEINPYHPSLRLHGLKGKLQGLSSVSINMNYRIVLEIVIQENQIILLNIGTHTQVY
mgnify:FL=1|jgi:addiction module RelE/StbE family toxin